MKTRYDQVLDFAIEDAKTESKELFLELYAPSKGGLLHSIAYDLIHNPPKDIKQAKIEYMILKRAIKNLYMRMK